MRKRLSLFVECEADEAAVPVLVKRLISASHPHAWSFLDLDPARDTFRVGNLGSLVKPERNGKPKWVNKLLASAKIGNLGGVLLLLDGDLSRFQGKTFCAADEAKRLAAMAQGEGAGKVFSVAVVFARMEYESWLIAGYESLPGGKAGVALPPAIEDHRDAKRWLRKNLQGGYKEADHQSLLTEKVALDRIRDPARKMRSIARLEGAIREPVTAIETGAHVSTPSDAPAHPPAAPPPP